MGVNFPNDCGIDEENVYDQSEIIKIIVLKNKMGNDIKDAMLKND